MKEFDYNSMTWYIIKISSPFLKIVQLPGESPTVYSNVCITCASLVKKFLLNSSVN